ASRGRGVFLEGAIRVPDLDAVDNFGHAALPCLLIESREGIHVLRRGRLRFGWVAGRAVGRTRAPATRAQEPEEPPTHEAKSMHGRLLGKARRGLQPLGHRPGGETAV